tara:strand:+ start:40032 stop:41048 length:1017 start_codon:yes stop_codon:yes gene_type:complete
MNYEGAKRFKGSAVGDFALYRETAHSYPRLLSDTEKLGFRQKPFDWSKGHPNFLGNMYQLLNGIDAMKLEPGATIVEVGSGAGWATEVLASLKYKVICIEPSDIMLETAKRRVTDFLRSHEMPELIGSVKYICNTFEEENLEENSADAVLFFESFHHIIDEEVAVAQIRNVLKPDGVLCILGDSNWIPGFREQEEFWEDEMRRYGTLESPFTHEYLIALLEHYQFYSVSRYHGVNAMIPVDQEEEPVGKFAGNLDARYVNLFTARNGKDRNFPERTISAPAQMPASPPTEIPSAPTTDASLENSSVVLSLATKIKMLSPKFAQPLFSRIWHDYIRKAR